MKPKYYLVTSTTNTHYIVVVERGIIRWAQAEYPAEHWRYLSAEGSKFKHFLLADDTVEEF